MGNAAVSLWDLHSCYSLRRSAGAALAKRRKRWSGPSLDNRGCVATSDCIIPRLVKALLKCAIAALKFVSLNRKR